MLLKWKRKETHLLMDALQTFNLMQTGVALIRFIVEQLRPILSFLMRFFEFIRWKLNIALLFRPFSCLASCRLCCEWHQFIYRLTMRKRHKHPRWTLTLIRLQAYIRSIIFTFLEKNGRIKYTNIYDFVYV